MTPTPHRWRKSRHSGQETNCVEVAHTLDRVRDSKSPHGAVLVVDVTALLADLRAGRLGA
jgi:Domain of unknown function (DUF397)